jgi:aldehyde:ferredoxin oxidoreductase
LEFPDLEFSAYLLFGVGPACLGFGISPTWFSKVESACGFALNWARKRKEVRMNGIWGKVLKVDLTNGTCKAEALPEKVYEYFLGGAGLAAYYMWKECPAGTTAFNPANRLTFAGGPMTGLKQTGAAKWTAGAILPATSMNAIRRPRPVSGIEMKETGFDAIVVRAGRRNLCTWS